MQRILVVDDERSMREVLKIMLEKEGYIVSLASSGEAARSMIETNPFDLILTDMRMPNGGGLVVLESAKKTNPHVPVIVMTAYASTENRLEAMRIGAFDYISKPFKNDEVHLIVKKALEQEGLRQENLLLRKELDDRYGFCNIIGKSPQMEEVFDLIRQVSDTKINILISGESGTGKELVARAIHFNSSRRGKPFVPVNCGAIPENLIESEFFGHKKGAFTGAYFNKKGLFKAADGGTIFLDEIGDLPLTMQIKLLRVIQERTFLPVGATEDEEVDVRVVAASNKDLKKEVAAGRFREDLYYRLNVIQIQLPPLRERQSDIPLLANFFLEKYKKELGKDIVKISDEAMELLKKYPFPGNIRELENIIERSVALERHNVILPETLPEQLHQTWPSLFKLHERHIPPEGIDLDRIMNDLERTLLLEALQRAGGVKKKAAQLLRISFRSIRYRLDKHNIDTGKDDEE